MTVALVLDFPGGTKEQYDEVVERMQLGGKLAPGSLAHSAGSYEGGWRVVDVWQDLATFGQFRDEKIIPFTSAAGLAAPNVFVLEADEEEFPGGTTGFVQCVKLPGLDHGSFHATDEEIRPGKEVPEGLTFHVNGPVDGGWCVVDGWTSRAARDAFMEARIKPAMASAPLQGPPTIEDLDVEATLADAHAHA
jgi:hypothetical protein